MSPANPDQVIFESQHSTETDRARSVMKRIPKVFTSSSKEDSDKSNDIDRGSMQKLLHKIRYGKGYGSILVRGALGAFTVKIAGTGIIFLLNVMLARILGAQQYGIYVFGITWIQILVVICLLGFQTSLIRFVAEYNFKRQWGCLCGILQISNRYVLGFSVGISLLGSLFLFILHDRISSEMAMTLFIALIYLPFLAFCRLREACLAGFKQVIHSELLLRVINPILTILATSVLFLWMGQEMTASTAMVATLAAILGTTITAQFFLVHKQPAPLKQVRPEFQTGNWLSVSLPLLLLAGGHVTILRIDILMLGIIHSSESAGIYAAACRASNFVIFGYMAINSILVPLMSELYHQRNLAALQQNVTRAARAMFGFTFLAGSLMIIFAGPILNLFGSQFGSASGAFSIIILGKIIFTFAGPAIWLMTVTNYQNQAAGLVLVAILLDVVLNAVLIPGFGINGAAAATTVSIVFWQSTAGLFIFWKTKINTTVIESL